MAFVGTRNHGTKDADDNSLYHGDWSRFARGRFYNRALLRALWDFVECQRRNVKSVLNTINDICPKGTKVLWHTKHVERTRKEFFNIERVGRLMLVTCRVLKNFSKPRFVDDCRLWCETWLQGQGSSANSEGNETFDTAKSISEGCVSFFPSS